MSKDLMTPAKVEDLVKSVMEGTSTESESGLVLRSLQLAVSGALVTGMSQMMESLSQYDDLIGRAYRKFEEKVNVALESDTMSIQDLLSLINSLGNKKMQVLELYRKVAQGKELFPTDVISEEEKKVLKLLKSFKSDSDKKKFIELCEQTFSKPESSNEFSDE